MTDAELLAGQDADSFAEFYRRHSRRMAGWLMRATGDPEAAADLTAETFAAALVARRRYDPDRGAPATWLYGIAANKLNDWRRKESTVLAAGVAPVAGPWQMEHYVSTRFADPETGEVIEPAGLPCLNLFLPDPPEVGGPAGGGQCGEFPKTPGFGRVQMTVRNSQGEAREILVYGRVPPEASAVVITVDGVERRRAEPFEGPSGIAGDFYLIPIPPEWDRGRVSWLDQNGNEGGGHGLMPR